MEEDQVHLPLLESNHNVHLSLELAEKLTPLTQKVAKAIGTYGIRLQRQAQTLSKARAVCDGRESVNEEDVHRVIEILAWSNLEFKPVPKLTVGVL